MAGYLRADGESPADRSARAVRDQRPWPRVARARRSRRAGVQRLPRQSRRDASRDIQHLRRCVVPVTRATASSSTAASTSEAFERNGWPECEKCHGNHAIDETDDSMLSEASNPLCYECHREYAAGQPGLRSRPRGSSTPRSRSLAHESGGARRARSTRWPEGARRRRADRRRPASSEDILRQSRSQIHAFDRGEFDDVGGARTRSDRDRPSSRQRSRGRVASISRDPRDRVRLLARTRAGSSKRGRRN